MLEKKNERKADLKEKELKLKSEELELQKKSLNRRLPRKGRG